MSKKEEIGELAISLSFESQNADKQISALNKSINRTEKEFKAAGKGVKNFENTYQGLDAKIKKTTKQLDDNNKKLKVQESEHKKISKAFQESKKKLDEMYGSIDKNSKEWKTQADLVQKNADKLSKLSTDISITKGNISKLSKELNESKSKFEALGNKTQTLDEKLEDISRSADLSQSEFNKLGAELNENGTYFQKLGNDMNRLASEINSGVSKIKAYETEINTLSISLDKNKENHNQLSKEINKTENELSKAKNEYGENSTKVNQLNQKLLVLKDSYNTLESEINQNENELKEYKTALNNTQAEVKELSNELLNMPFDKVSSDLKNAGNNLKSVGQTLTTSVTLPIVGVGAAATKIGIDFDRAMSEVQAISGATGEDFIKLKTMAEDMGRSTKFSASQAAEAMTYMGMAGWKTNDMLSGLPGILNLAAAGGTDLAVASDIVTDGLTGLGLTANDSSKFVDIMAATITNANTNVEMMGETLKYAGPVAGSLGIKMEDLSLAIGLMGNAGIKSSQAGTALRGGLTNLVKPTDDMEAAMKKYGVSIQKSNDGSVDLMATIKLLRDKLGGLEETTQANVLATIFGKEAMSGWASVVNASEADFTKLNTAISNSEGKATELAEVMQQNLGGSIDNMKSALEGALKDGFEAMLPVLEKVVESITNIAKWFSSLDEEAQRNIVTMAGIVAAIGPILIAVGQLIVVGGNAVTLFGKLTTAGGNTAKVIGLLKQGFKLLGGTTGIGAAILAVTVAVKAFKELDKQMQKETIPSINSVIDNMSDLSDETKYAVKPFLELGQTVETEFMKMNTAGVIMTSEMKTSVIKNLDEMTNGVSESITKSKDEAVKGLESMFNATVSITEEEKIQIVEKTKEAYDSKVDTITNSKAKINEILNIALSENRELNIEEENQIRTHYKNIKDISLESMVSSKDELLAIKKELNIHSKELSAQQASDVIKEATKQRDESINAAKNEYEKRLEYASILRSQGGKENEELASKVIEEAKRMKDGQITQANLAADNVIASARTQAGEYIKNIDYMTGEVLNGWDKLNFDLIEMMSNFTNSILETSQDLGAGTQILFNQMKAGLLDFVLSSIEWWRELPFTDSDAFNGIYENCKKALDETNNYIKTKNEEIEELSLFRSLPGKVKDNMTRVKDILETHFKVPMEQLLFDTQIWSNMTADEFYKLPQDVQQALRKVDQSLVETGENGLGAFLAKSQMMSDGVIFSFDQLDKDTQLSMSNVEQSLMDLNGINLEQFVLQCVTAADEGKTAFEDLPVGVQGSINEINNQLVNRHGLTLEQFILNTKKATGEYKETIDKDTKEAANKADENSKKEKEKVLNNKESEKKEVLEKEKQKTTQKDSEQKKQVSNAEKNSKDEKSKVELNKKAEKKNIEDTEKTKTSNLDKEGKKQADNAGKNANKAKNDSGKAYKDSSKEVQQSATDMYNGSKKSYSKMADVARSEGTRMYKGVTTSAKKMSDNARSSATEMYKGVTTSTRKMADKAIEDWNRIRNSYSKSINGKITKTTVNKTISTGDGPTRSIINDDISMINNRTAIPKIKTPDISDFAVSGKYYNPKSVSITDNKQNTLNNIDNKETNELLKQIIMLLKQEHNQNNMSYDTNIDDREYIKYISENIARNVRRRL